MRKIMVADDDPNMVEIVCEVLRFAGYEAVAEMSPTAVMDRAVAESPDLILLDLMMPGLDGWQLLEMLQPTGNCRHSYRYLHRRGAIPA